MEEGDHLSHIPKEEMKKIFKIKKNYTDVKQGLMQAQGHPLIHFIYFWFAIGVIVYTKVFE